MNPEMPFEKQIKEITWEDGAQIVTLVCGHQLWMAVPLHKSITTMPCAQCVNDFIEASR